MKKEILTVAAVFVLTFSGLALAQMEKGKDMMGDGMMKGGMMGGKMGMCPMMGGMMSSMMGKSMVGTSDGGVIVLNGNMITKYDKDLNVVKEVEMKMDMEGMQKMMENMKSMCPMMGKGMMGDMDNDAGEAAEKTAPAKEVDHASHH